MRGGGGQQGLEGSKMSTPTQEGGGGRQNGKILSTWLLNAPYVKKRTTISCHSLLNHIGQAIDLLILLDVDHAY